MLECTITETKNIEPVVYDWGAVKWVANRDLDPGCEQSFGLVHILPGKTNPEHWHTNAEEIIYMLQGECDVRLGDRHVTIKPGQTLHIPPAPSTRWRTSAGSRWCMSARFQPACAARCSRIPQRPACARWSAGAQVNPGEPEARNGGEIRSDRNWRRPCRREGSSPGCVLWKTCLPC